MPEVAVLDLEDLQPAKREEAAVIPQLPFFLLEGVAFDAELDYVLTESGLPVYYYDGVSYNSLGFVEPRVDIIIRMKFLHIGVKLHRSDGSVNDFSSPEHYIPLINL